MKVFDFAQVARIAMDQYRERFRSIMSTISKAMRWIKTPWLFSSGWISARRGWDHAVDILRKKGYFLGGVLPRWFDHDGILMQKLFCSPDFDGIRLHSERSHKILEMVKQDWGRAQAL